MEMLIGNIDSYLFLEVFNDGSVEQVIFAVEVSSDGGLDGSHD